MRILKDIYDFLYDIWENSYHIILLVLALIGDVFIWIYMGPVHGIGALISLCMGLCGGILLRYII